MSYILYYSNFCNHSKDLIQNISRKGIKTDDIHFICIDSRRVENGKMYIMFPNGQKIIMPENIRRVPSLMIINEGFRVIDDSEEIKRIIWMREKHEIQNATNNNMEPIAYGFGGGSSVTSDMYSFVDQDYKEMEAKGNGGMRQLHNYAILGDDELKIYTPQDEVDYKNNPKLGQEITIDNLKQQRELEYNNLVPKR